MDGGLWRQETAVGPQYRALWRWEGQSLGTDAGGWEGGRIMAFPLKLETKADSCGQLQQAGPTPRVPGARGNPAGLWPRPASCPSVKGSASQPGPGPALNPGNLILSKYQALPIGNSPRSPSDSIPKLQGSAQHHPRAYQTPTPLPANAGHPHPSKRRPCFSLVDKIWVPLGTAVPSKGLIRPCRRPTILSGDCVPQLIGTCSFFCTKLQL